MLARYFVLAPDNRCLQVIAGPVQTPGDAGQEVLTMNVRYSGRAVIDANTLPGGARSRREKLLEIIVTYRLFGRFCGKFPDAQVHSLSRPGIGRRFVRREKNL